MTDEKNESSYKKLQASNESLKKSNAELTVTTVDLTAKVNTLLDALEKEKADKSRFELVAKINSINKEFKATDEMDDSFLKGVHYAWSNIPKKNVKKTNAEIFKENGGVTPPPINTTDPIILNGKPIPDDLKAFMADRQDLAEHKAEAAGEVM